MPAGNFSLYNVSFKRKGTGRWVFMSGEITNNLKRDYTSTVFKLSVFERDTILWSGSIKIRNFRKGHTKPFEVLMDGLVHNITPRISRYEIYFESGY